MASYTTGIVALSSLVAVRNVSDACMDSADQALWEGAVKTNISAIQQACILEGAPGAAWYDHCIKHFMNSSDDGERCMQDCVGKRTQLSAPCSGCFAKLSGCVYEHCISPCIDAASPACAACGDEHCTPDFVRCSGIRDLPPPNASHMGMLLAPSSSSNGIPSSIEKVLHDLVCKELTNGTAKGAVVSRACEALHGKVKFLPEAACEEAAKLFWEKGEVAYCKSEVAKAAELRRWDNSNNCTGEYSTLSTDNMNECTQYLIPAPASICVEQKNDTAYSSYHCQGVTDCSKEKRTFLADWAVGVCEVFGDYSQMRVWIAPQSTAVIVV